MRKETDLWETLLLKIGDNTLTNQVGSTNDMKDFIVVLPNKSELESIFCRIDWDRSRFRVSIKTMNDLPLDSGEVNGLIKSFDDTVISAKGPVVV